MESQLVREVRRILGEEGVRNGEYVDFHCPFHEDRNESLRVNPRRNMIACWACTIFFTGKKGKSTIEEFIEKVTGKLPEGFVPSELPDRRLEQLWRHLPSSLITEVLDLLIEEATILTDADLKTCMQKYGLSEKTIREAKIRSGRSIRMEPLLEKFSAMKLIQSGIFNYKDKVPHRLAFYFWKRLLIPHLWDGRVVDCRSRAPFDAEQAKYFGLRGRSPRPYLTPGVEDSEWIIETEGEFKALAGFEHVCPAIGLPGIGQFRSVPPHLLKGKRVMIIYDQHNRPVERKAAQASARYAIACGADPMILELPWKGEKVGLDDYLKGGGRLKSLPRVPLEAVKP